MWAFVSLVARLSAHTSRESLATGVAVPGAHGPNTQTGRNSPLLRLYGLTLLLLSDNSGSCGKALLIDLIRVSFDQGPVCLE